MAKKDELEELKKRVEELEEEKGKDSFGMTQEEWRNAIIFFAVIIICLLLVQIWR